MLVEKLKGFESKVIGNLEKIQEDNIEMCIFKKDVNNYFKQETKKEKIVLHHTVGNLYGDFISLTRPNIKICTSYLIASNGTIINLFPDKYWSYHLGKTALGGNAAESRKSIGIEISNYGPLREENGKLYNVYNQLFCSIENKELYTEYDYRGYKYWHNYTDAQYEALKKLLTYLCKKHNIPYTFLPEELRKQTTSEAISFKGIVTHVNYRLDKTDVSPIFNYNSIAPNEV